MTGIDLTDDYVRTGEVLCEWVGLDERISLDRSEFALEFFDQLLSNGSGAADSPLGLHILMGDSALEKVGNMIDNVKEGRVAPYEIIVEKP